MPRSTLLLLLPATAAAAALAAPVLAAPARVAQKNASISVVDFMFQPSAAKLTLGGTVSWHFNGAVAHTATDTSGMLLYDSGPKAAGTSFAFTFTAAGSYPFDCAIHPTVMRGNVTVPMKLKPAKGTTASTFTLTWATRSAPSGFVYDVQVERPGATGFVDFMAGTTAASVTFHPDAGHGKYLFHARLRRLAGGQSGFSPDKGITVS